MILRIDVGVSATLSPLLHQRGESARGYRSAAAGVQLAMPVSSIWDIPSVEKDGGGAAGGGGAGYSECLDSCLVRCSCPLPNECLTRACLRSLA